MTQCHLEIQKQHNVHPLFVSLLTEVLSSSCIPKWHNWREPVLMRRIFESHIYKAIEQQGNELGKAPGPRYKAERCSEDDKMHFACTANVFTVPLHGSLSNSAFEILTVQLFLPWQACHIAGIKYTPLGVSNVLGWRNYHHEAILANGHCALSMIKSSTSLQSE